MLLYIYQLRFHGARIARDGLPSYPGIRADLRYYRTPFGFFGDDVMVAQAVDQDGSGKDALPMLRHARVIRCEGGLLIAGMQTTFRGAKSKGTTARQSWWCVVDRMPWDPWNPANLAAPSAAPPPACTTHGQPRQH